MLSSFCSTHLHRCITFVFLWQPAAEDLLVLFYFAAPVFAFCMKCYLQKSVESRAECLWYFFFSSSRRIKEYSNWRDDSQLLQACSRRLDFFVYERVCAFIIYCMPANSMHSLTQIHWRYLHFLFVQMEEKPFIIMWLFTMTHTVISEMDVSSRCCGEYPSMTLYTVPMHTEPETMLPALSSIAVIHWRGIPRRCCTFAAEMYCYFA